MMKLALALIFLVFSLFALYEIWRSRKQHRKRRRRQRIKNIGGFESYSIPGDPEWKWFGKKSFRILRSSLVLGNFNSKSGDIKIYLGSIMKAADDEEQAILLTEETVVHELVHWAGKHEAKSENKHTDENHAERYKEVLEPIIKEQWNIHEREKQA